MADPLPTPSTAIFARHALLAQGWCHDVRITLTAGRITAITPATTARADDEIAAILLPGLPNLHSHAFQRAIAGRTERRGPGDDSFWTWREAMYHAASHITPDHLHAIAAFAYMEMLEAGFTRVGEFHYLHHAPDGAAYDNPAAMCQAIAAAAHDSGIALTLLPVYYARGGFDGAPLTPRQRRFGHTPDRFANLLDHAAPMLRDLPDAILGVAPHSLRAASITDIAAIAALRPGQPVHIHISEQIAEISQCRATHGTTPIAYLADHIALSPRWCLVHATHATPAELPLISQTGAIAGLCPITEANLGDGIFPLADFLALGGRLGIGTDSNVHINAAEELRLLEYSQRLHHRARNIAPREAGGRSGATLFHASLLGGAQALGAPAGIALGNPGDLISLQAENPDFVGQSDDGLIDALVFAAHGGIDRVWRAGRPVVRGQRHVARDAITARYRRTLSAIFA